jgi:hypothetical protein
MPVLPLRERPFDVAPSTDFDFEPKDAADPTVIHRCRRSVAVAAALAAGAAGAVIGFLVGVLAR